jgi:hypothetical protein
MWSLGTLKAINQEVAKTKDIDKAFANCGISLSGRRELIRDVEKKSDSTELKSSKFFYILENLRKKTPDESKQSLIDAGIITADGELAEKYQ